jgi:hypothetical protein
MAGLFGHVVALAWTAMTQLQIFYAAWTTPHIAVIVFYVAVFA